MLRQTSLGTLGLSVGGVLTITGFVAYFTGNATLNLAGFFYGIPLLLGGLALKAAEIKPVPYSQEPSPEALKLREQQATKIQNQLRKDVMRYRFGQPVHLDSSLENLGLSPSDEECPVLKGLREEVVDGAYALVLEFDSEHIPLSTWQEKEERIGKFFGPGIRAEVVSGGPKEVHVSLITLPEAIAAS